MKSRDRSIIGLAVLMLIALGGYFLLVQPEHHKSSALQGQIASVQGQLSQAEAAVRSGAAAEAQYKAYASRLAAVGVAVPSDQQIPQLINELQAASSRSRVSFQAVSVSSTPAVATSTTASSFASQNLNLSFTGNYFAVSGLLGRLDGFVRADNKHFHATGRLITIGTLALAPGGSGTTSATANSGAVTATVTAVDYDVPSALAAAAATSAPTTSGTASPTALVTH